MQKKMAITLALEHKSVGDKKTPGGPRWMMGISRGQAGGGQRTC